MGSVWGKQIKISIFGESHGPSIGVTIDGFPHGIRVDEEFILNEIARRSPATYRTATKRREKDQPDIISGIFDGYTTGAPITALFENKDTKRQEYEAFQATPRPGHGDFTAKVRYDGFADISGGGHLSGRLTLPLVFAGALCKLALRKKGIQIRGHLKQIGQIFDSIPNYTVHDPDIFLEAEDHSLPVIDGEQCDKMEKALAHAAKNGNSLSGAVECVIYGLHAGVGSPIFDNIESNLSSILFGIPGVKGVLFGDDPVELTGMQYNDPFVFENGMIKTETNHCGGILGGISNGMPIYFTVQFKPTASVFQPQTTLNMQTLQQEELQITGRHDPCIAVRAVPAVECAAAISILNIISEVHYE